MKYKYGAILVLLLIGIFSTIVTAQTVSIPEEIKTKCNDIPLKNRVRITVAEFAFSATGEKGNNIDNFSSMLSNALVNINCYRVLSMLKDSSQLEGGKGRSLTPQAIVTGEITEYSHTTKTQSAFGATKITTTAHIGYIVQVKNNTTGDILFSESRNVDGTANNSSLTSTVKMRNSPFGSGNYRQQSEGDHVQAAYQDAMEKAIIEAIEVLVERHDRLVQDLVENLPGDSEKPKVATNKTTNLEVANTDFKSLSELESKLKSFSWVKSTNKSLASTSGKLVISHTGTDEDIVNVVILFGDKYEIVEFNNNGKIKVKQKIN